MLHPAFGHISKQGHTHLDIRYIPYLDVNAILRHVFCPLALLPQLSEMGRKGVAKTQEHTRAELPRQCSNISFWPALHILPREKVVIRPENTEQQRNNMQSSLNTYGLKCYANNS
jgi:hypothetical protein